MWFIIGFIASFVKLAVLTYIALLPFVLIGHFIERRK